jgi:hypothetical protein
MTDADAALKERGRVAVAVRRQGRLTDSDSIDIGDGVKFQRVRFACWGITDSSNNGASRRDNVFKRLFRYISVPLP